MVFPKPLARQDYRKRLFVLKQNKSPKADQPPFMSPYGAEKPCFSSHLGAL